MLQDIDCVITGHSIPTAPLTRVKRRQVTQLNKNRKSNETFEHVQLTDKEVDIA